MSDKVKPKVYFCSKCMYPSSSAVNFDENMVCTGCQVGLEKVEIDWDKRKSMLLELVKQYKNKDSKYDCIIPVSV